MISLVEKASDTWDESLLTFQSCINGTFHSSVGESPHFLLYGADKRLLYDLFQETNTPSCKDNYADYLSNRNKSIFSSTK